MANLKELKGRINSVKSTQKITKAKKMVAAAKLRKAQADLWYTFKHLRTMTRLKIALIEKQQYYDFPDQMDIGSVARVSCQSADQKYEWTLEPGIKPTDRTNAALAAVTADFQPSIYCLIDGQINVLAGPSSTPGTLIIQGVLRPAALVEDDDRPTVDGECCVRYAEIELKKFKKMISLPEYQAEMADFRKFALSVQHQQSDKASFQLGSGWKDPAETYVPRRRPWWLSNRRP